VRYEVAVLKGREMAPLVPLFREAFGRSMFRPDWLHRKYDYSDRGIGGFSCTAFASDGRPAATLGVLPFGIRFGDRRETAGQLVDAATAVEHRGRGLFGRLEGLIRELAEKIGLSFLFAFPHLQGDSYPLFVDKLGYAHLDDLVEHRLPVRGLPVASAADRLPGFASGYQRQVARRLNRLASTDPVLPNSLGSGGLACVDRNAEFFAYKRSFSGARVIGSPPRRAWLRPGRSLFLGDLEATSDEDVGRTLGELRSLARRIGVRDVVLQASRDSRFTHVFAPVCEPGVGLAVVHHQVSSQIPPESLRFSFGDLDNF
jgi:hypothetical protein